MDWIECSAEESNVHEMWSAPPSVQIPGPRCKPNHVALVRLAIVRHTVLNLLSRAKPTISLKNRRKRAGWNVDYLETLIRQTA